jgi:hypothetical protein
VTGAQRSLAMPIPNPTPPLPHAASPRPSPASPRAPAHGLVAHDGHFAISRCGLKRDDPTPLKKPQDALARALHHLVDVLLTRPRRRVEHLAFPVDVRRIHTIQKK